MPLWCQDEAGPYQAIPQPGEDWHLQGKPTRQPHEYVRGGTAKLLTLFRPATGDVHAKGVLSAPNAVRHPWLQEELQRERDQLDQEPLAVRVPLPEDHPLLLTWQHPSDGQALVTVTLPEDHPLLLTWQHWYWSYERPKPAPALRLILIWDNLKGHLSYHMVRWLLQRGILPLSTPLSGSWLNMAESLQRIIVRRALSGQNPQSAKPSHRLVGANRGGLEPQAHALCLEWQAAPTTRTGPTATSWWVRGRCSAWLLNCQLTH